MGASAVATQVLGATALPIVQLHPSLRCNLSCAHCYSSSGPRASVELDLQPLLNVITDAAAMGYRVISVAGGEPMIYRGLEELLRHAKSLGMRTTVTTNGYFLDWNRLERLRSDLDLIAISLDGPPDLHNKIRGSSRAFERMERGLEALRKSGIKFGFVHTLTSESWEHLPWVARFAEENGAALLQIHPLENAGRAKLTMDASLPDEIALAKGFLTGVILDHKYSSLMTIQTDLLHRDDVVGRPQLIYASDMESDPQDASPAALLGLLVVEADGTVVPLSYGFSRAYQIGNINDERLVDAWDSYVTDGYPAFRRLCRAEFAAISSSAEPALFNWHERITARSHLQAVVMADRRL